MGGEVEKGDNGGQEIGKEKGIESKLTRTLFIS